jgi:hypothetical protein
MMRGLLTAVVANAVLALRAFAFGYAARVVERTPARVPPLAYMPQRSRHVSLAWDAVRCAVLVQAELGIPAPGGVREAALSGARGEESTRRFTPTPGLEPGTPLLRVKSSQRPEIAYPQGPGRNVKMTEGRSEAALSS